MLLRHLCLALLLACLHASFCPAQSAREQALAAMKKAATYYREKVARHGGYVYYTGLDLKQRWGEGRADQNTIFVEPPGTPTVGMAYLKAYHATGDRYYLDAAKETAKALVHGQLQSGGWTQTIHFGPAKRLGKYRNGKGGKWNVSSLDDNQTQSALRMLILTDQALGRKDKDIHEAAEYGLKALLKAQFPNGGFPQVWQKPVEAKPVLKARFPDYDWKAKGRVKNYWDYYTLNDGVAGSVAEVLITAHEVYKDDRYRSALEKLGDFLILAQMPDPQPAWCQQYNYEMQPMWARKFEPPAITAWESQDAMRALIRIARYTGKKKYLAPVPRALDYLEKCVLKDGRVARYYELKTNKPLYMDAKYQLTHDDSAAPKHYGWKQPQRFEDIRKEYEAALKGAAPAPARKTSEAKARAIAAALDEQGRWVSTYAGQHLTGQPKFERGFKFLSSREFSRNLEALSGFVAERK